MINIKLNRENKFYKLHAKSIFCFLVGTRQTYDSSLYGQKIARPLSLEFPPYSSAQLVFLSSSFLGPRHRPQIIGRGEVR